jgi:hypothetical protein
MSAPAGGLAGSHLVSSISSPQCGVQTFGLVSLLPQELGLAGSS